MVYAFADDTVTVTIHCVFLIFVIILSEHGIHTVINDQFRMRIKAVTLLTAIDCIYAVHCIIL